MTQQSMGFTRGLIAVVVLVLLGVLAYGFLTKPDQRSLTDRVGDAIHALPQGADKASEQLQDRTPGQKLGDSVKDAGQDIKNNTAPQ